MAEKDAFIGAAIIRLGTVSSPPAYTNTRKVIIKNIDLSDPDVDHERQPPIGAPRPRKPDWTPFDIDFDEGEIGEGATVRVIVKLAGNFVFQENGLSITTANPVAQPHMDLLDDYKPNEAVFFVKNVKGMDFDFNIGVIYSKPGAQWELPVFIDPKIHNNGGG